MQSSDSQLKALEFFAGGGLARLGLEPHFECVFANDIDPMKADVYRANFGDAHLNVGDVWRIKPQSLPTADLAWASFPCQDLSLAGARKGLNAPRSGTFWGFWRLVEALASNERAPDTLALENVTGLLSSRGGRDFIALIETIANSGYRVGAMVLDAEMFTPQSRQRLFIIAYKGRIPKGLEAGPRPHFHPPAMQSLVSRMDSATQMAWIWWRLPDAPKRNTQLEDILDREVDPALWRSEEACQKLINQMAPQHFTRFEAALAENTFRAGAVYRRIRMEQGHKIQRAEVRYDGLAGCLRTPAGGSSKQLLLITENKKARLRPLSSREAARLMGLDETYRLPTKETPALKVLGDGVSTSVVRWLTENLLAPLNAEKRLHTKEKAA